MFNLTSETLSPLNQFEIRDMFSLETLGEQRFSITNISFYLILGGLFTLIFTLLSTNYNRLVGNN